MHVRSFFDVKGDMIRKRIFVFSAIAIPYMTSHGLSESTAMGVYAAAGVWSIANDLIAGWLSENCTASIGEFHRRVS